jgi:hypothetical protein
MSGHFAPLKIVPRSFENAVQWLSDHGFQVTRAAGASACTVSKYGCAAGIEVGRDGLSRITQFPACLVAGEPAELVDRGYQKFFKTSQCELPATADRLEALNRFSEELKQALGYTSLYNEGLGSVSARYQYDRVASRDLPPTSRPVRPWQK